MTVFPRPRRMALTGTPVPVDVREQLRVDRSLPADGYRLRIAADAVSIDVADDAGAFYARQTLGQLASSGGYRTGEVEDWPDLAVRGVMLDISRTKVPTMATLEALVDRLAGWKVNHLQLYTEHTFAYPGHDVVWEGASPMTAGEVEALGAYCRDRHIELAANQNCLGHMERWLRHDRYHPLALSPEGFTPPWGGLPRPPTTLDPASEEAFALVRELLGALVPHFGSRRVNVGLDEPWELASERIGDYVDWVTRLRAAPELAGREMLMWGDIVAHHPSVLGALGDDVTVCEWGYEADHPFEDRARALAGAGRAWWICPGTSSWNSIIGRLPNALANITAAAGAAHTYGASGWLLTDWGDNGHLQYLPISLPGLAYGAAMAWCAATNRDLDVSGALGAPGPALVALGSVADAVGPAAGALGNASVLTVPLYWPYARLGGRIATLLPTDLDAAAAALDAGVQLIAGIDAPGRTGHAAASPREPIDSPGAANPLVAAELANGARLVGLLIDDARARLAGDGRLASIPAPVRLTLEKRLREVIDEHQRLWLARNRPGGLEESTAWLERVADGYRTGVIAKPAMAYGP